MCFLVLTLGQPGFVTPSGWFTQGLLLFQSSPASLGSLVERQNEQVQRALVLVLIPVVVAFSFIVFFF